MRIFLDLAWFFRQEWHRYLLGISILAAVAVLNLIPPRIVGGLVDDISHQRIRGSLLLRDLALLLAIALVVYALRQAWRRMLYGSSARLARLLRDRLYRHYSQLSPRFYQQHRVGDLMAHATNDIQAIEQTAGDGILTLADSITTGALVVGTMAFTIDWKLTLVVLIPMPFMAWATSRYGLLLHDRFLLAQAAFSDLNGKVQENISGVRVIKAFGQEAAERRAFAELSEEVVARNVAVARIDALFDPTIQLIVGLSYFLAVAVGAVFVVRGGLTIGDLTAFTMYLGQLIWPMLAFGFLINIVERGRASYDRVRRLLEEPVDILDHPDATDTPPAGDLEVRIERFTYPGAAEPALSDVRFRLPRGATLGVVGRTGSGKTTLLRLLLREFDVEAGDIAIGGRSIYQVTLRALRRSIAYVPQDHFLFSATIAENIAFAKPEAGRDEIVAAARMADVDADIRRFPGGYDTLVGERGVTLSGGQKQRISIARALLMDAEILVLDDALSAVDARTEARILAALREQRAGRTTVIAAHRLSAVQHANLIVVLEGGRIREMGRHEDLLAAGGWYAQTYARQQLEALVEEGGHPWQA
ncbi:ABC transporter transmembrane domain-containing protein [Alicyclobacillus macrosporangiidus]|uniref:ATP-binding cassette, subfamily B n=1 Tax=Alicyclobacillus macrosporangiidus TaxID=392015 RepID=A0A1I7JDX2_9BACL|nr:ABC transporter transmembrane domain-containing protein [Alicyclobacillus macrosporangiidus]SFU83338.1 ATP-binding cassette, subfamily B [Alicyclobacillus macrosporangiidus]